MFADASQVPVLQKCEWLIQDVQLSGRQMAIGKVKGSWSSFSRPWRASVFCGHTTDTASLQASAGAFLLARLFAQTSLLSMAAQVSAKKQQGEHISFLLFILNMLIFHKSCRLNTPTIKKLYKPLLRKLVMLSKKRKNTSKSKHLPIVSC